MRDKPVMAPVPSLCADWAELGTSVPWAPKVQALGPGLLGPWCGAAAGK